MGENRQVGDEPEQRAQKQTQTGSHLTLDRGPQANNEAKINFSTNGIKNKTMKLIEDFGFGNDFLDTTPFPCGSAGKESAYPCRKRRRCGFDPWVRKILWRREWQPTPVFLPGEFHGQRSLVGYRSWGCKELNMIERLSTP